MISSIQTLHVSIPETAKALSPRRKCQITVTCGDISYSFALATAIVRRNSSCCAASTLPSLWKSSPANMARVNNLSPALPLTWSPPCSWHGGLEQLATADQNRYFIGGIAAVSSSAVGISATYLPPKEPLPLSPARALTSSYLIMNQRFGGSNSTKGSLTPVPADLPLSILIDLLNHVAEVVCIRTLSTYPSSISVLITNSRWRGLVGSNHGFLLHLAIFFPSNSSNCHVSILAQLSCGHPVPPNMSCHWSSLQNFHIAVFLNAEINGSA